MNPLIVFALPHESGTLPKKYSNLTFLHTGVGKVNAAIQLTETLSISKLNLSEFDFVLNLGTAGSQTLNKGNLVLANEFYQHDMDVTPLNFKKGQTPFDSSPLWLTPLNHEFSGTILNKVTSTQVTLGKIATGDIFVTSELTPKVEAIDMEAYSLAKTCLKFKLPMVCLKYITDGADKDAISDWPAELKKAQTLFDEILSLL